VPEAVIGAEPTHLEANGGRLVPGACGPRPGVRLWPGPCQDIDRKRAVAMAQHQAAAAELAGAGACARPLVGSAACGRRRTHKLATGTGRVAF